MFQTVEKPRTSRLEPGYGKPMCKGSQWTGTYNQGVCMLPPDPGLCFVLEERWYFDYHLQKCRPFTWGGCKANENNFKDRRECEAACMRYGESQNQTLWRMAQSREGSFGPQSLLLSHIQPFGEGGAGGSPSSGFSSLGFRSIMKPGVLWLLVGILVLREGAQASDYGQQEKKGKAGFCMPSPNGLYDPPCKVACEGDTECPGAEKCCEHACHYKCMPPCREKAGHCPPPLMKKLNGPSLCDVVCAEDKDCPGMEKCCSTGCGFICTPPLEEKAGKCPRQRWVKRPLDSPCYDTCLQDQQCPGRMKCCFTGCSMSCIDVQKEDPVDSDL
ncbi:whey acidic protein-like [Sceloporus undulatus]|uniref:whey acidic protein-like n=1 Tax=Sceloporus undulatus TaxID=8520 RepID=UPI001C4ACC44|nr:whey acidic protein-like [Sceloporus undulatus]